MITTTWNASNERDGFAEVSLTAPDTRSAVMLIESFIATDDKSIACLLLADAIGRDKTDATLAAGQSAFDYEMAIMRDPLKIVTKGSVITVKTDLGTADAAAKALRSVLTMATAEQLRIEG